MYSYQELVRLDFYRTFKEITSKSLIKDICDYFYKNESSLSYKKSQLFKAYLSTQLDIEYIGNGIFQHTNWCNQKYDATTGTSNRVKSEVLNSIPNGWG